MGVSGPVRSSFSGFPPSTLSFLKGLAKHNEKAWFEKHRSDYEEGYVEAGKAFVMAVAPHLEKLAPKVCAEPRINGSIFRINRDVRFSKDKTPYKPHLDMWFWEGERRGALSGFFVRFAPEGVIVGAGCHGMDSASLGAFRKAVSGHGAELGRVAGTLEKAGYTVAGEHYKRPPKGFETVPAAARFLQFNALHVAADEGTSCMASRAAVDLCVDHWRKMLPLHRWLVDRVRT